MISLSILDKFSLNQKQSVFIFDCSCSYTFSLKTRAVHSHLKESWTKNLNNRTMARGYNKKFMLNSAETEILNACKYKNNKKISLFQAQIKCNASFPTSVGVLTLMSRKNFMLS